MKDEIDAAVKFIIKLIKQNSKIKEKDLNNFQQYLKLFLTQKFLNHWHPDRPWQGQGYRCLRVNGTNGKEPTIAKAASECGLKYSDLKLPIELTVWVDPTEVSCRFGEHKGSYCNVASFRNGQKKTFINEIDLNEIDQRDSVNDNVKNGNVPTSPPPTPALSDSSSKENISPDKGERINFLGTHQNVPMNSESRKLCSPFDLNSLQNNVKTAKGFNCNSPFSYKQQQQGARSVYQHADSGSGLTLYNRNPVPNGSHYYKPSSWVSYPTSISPPQHHALPPSSYYEYSPPPPPQFSSSQDNLNYSRVSPVNLNELQWYSGHYPGVTNPYARNGWVMRRQLVGV